jgi:hypothetical protein
VVKGKAFMLHGVRMSGVGADYASSTMGYDIFFCMLFVNMCVKTRALTQLSDRNEATCNGSATDADVVLLVP